MFDAHLHSSTLQLMQSNSRFTFVLFGGTGDLSMRKILPALFEAHRTDMLNPEGKIVCVARESLDQAQLAH
jgi:glucose-6-phosphate 1-dehydrogenase